MAFTRYALEFNGSNIGTYVHGFQSSFQRVTAINPRHNFWDTTVLLDGSYPALVWDHKFVLYTEGTSLNDFAVKYLNLADLVAGSAAALKIVNASSPSGVLLNFGSCYFSASPELQKPELLLLQEAGFITVSFLGSTKPTA